jgi:hypothetical protein
MGKTTLCVVRLFNHEDKMGNYKLGKSLPCEHCQKWLSYYGVTRVKYTDVINGVSVLCTMKLRLH